MLTPADRFVLAAILALAVNGILYPRAFKRLLRWRWLLFAILLILPNLLWVGEMDAELLGVPISLYGLRIGLQMALRMIIVLIAVDGFSSTVDISEVAGLFERVGLPGLGFSIGVAVNLLPSLRHSSFCAWHAMRMRGGFRRQRLRSLRFLVVTIVANALRRAEGIALAAEARAFSPERSRPLPMKNGRYDWPIAAGLLGVWLGLLFVP
jgi:energy-coupling factor transport system permease protein